MKFTVSVDKHAAKFLRNLTDARLYGRIRVGDYRIVYAVFQQELVVLVVAIGHRKDIYR